MTEGFGHKWKDFFFALEAHHNLDVSDPSHIWLLHWLFIAAINTEALGWAEAWNDHKIQLEGERRSTPQQLFIRSSVTDGIRGLPPHSSNDGEEIEDYMSFGVDWGALQDPQLMAHHQENNPGSTAIDHPYDHPDWINEVVCDPPDCPLASDQVERLERDLAAVVDIESKDMNVRRVVWSTALQLYTQLVPDGLDEIITF